jgi:hypothetical protein
MEIITDRVTVKNGEYIILLDYVNDAATISNMCGELYIDDIHDLKTLAEVINAATKLIEERMLNTDERPVI